MTYLNYITSAFPKTQLTNNEILGEGSTWTNEKVINKLGIKSRQVCATDEYASDLAIRAAEKLFEKVDRDSIDFVLYCSQSPDYLIPTTACILQEKLKISKKSGCLDFNLGCSGYIYGLGLAHGLISSQQAKNVLLITAETYSKYLAPEDISNRLIFGDGATCSLVSSENLGAGLKIGSFEYGTDGSGWDKLFSERHGIKAKKDLTTLYMDGPEILKFTLREIPELLKEICKKNSVSLEELDYLVLHQANKVVLDQLTLKLKLDEKRVAKNFENYGNTVSCTIPIVLEGLIQNNLLSKQQKLALVGFGVGFSWGGVVLEKTL